MTLVWLPFHSRHLGGVDPRYEFDRYSEGEPPPRIDELELWVPQYGFTLPYADLIPQMSSLRVIQTQSAGVEHVQRHVPAQVSLCNARGVHDAATAEMGMALILASLRRIPSFVEAQGREEWLASDLYPALADRSVLVVGHGSIGAALERRLDGFECEVTRVARTARDGVHGTDELPHLLPRADVVVLLVPMSEATSHMVDEHFLAAMKDDALLVNLARGGIVDTDALLAETTSGRLRAALDVTDPEPLPAGHPLWSSPGVLISPHAAGGTTAMAPRMFALVREQLRRYAAGEPLLNQVDS